MNKLNEATFLFNAEKRQMGEFQTDEGGPEEQFIFLFGLKLTWFSMECIREHKVSLSLSLTLP